MGSMEAVGVLLDNSDEPRVRDEARRALALLGATVPCSLPGGVVWSCICALLDSCCAFLRA
ncbi:hypothetical protein SETIT_9G199400v2 [Setaria italica]|uniref:Uncharacterized protein n=1 Tax=Setaria italica TaxID=4555 RepID=A0A368SIN8_SETIT|nr:hypothetical protein SETIT_9G199400v2 [Setaria italica]